MKYIFVGKTAQPAIRVQGAGRQKCFAAPPSRLFNSRRQALILLEKCTRASFARPNVRAKGATSGGPRQARAWRKCTAYRQTGLGGLPLALRLNEGLGISAISVRRTRLDGWGQFTPWWTPSLSAGGDISRRPRRTYTWRSFSVLSMRAVSGGPEMPAAYFISCTRRIASVYEAAGSKPPKSLASAATPSRGRSGNSAWSEALRPLVARAGARARGVIA